MSHLSDIIKKSQNQEVFSKDEIVKMLTYRPDSPEAYKIMHEANRISKELTGDRAEVHAQFALNLAKCHCDCKFCSFADVNDIFNENVELSVVDAVNLAKQFELEGANAIYLMATANFSFGKFVEISKEIRNNLKNNTILVANVGDCSYSQAKNIKNAGIQAVYHALRLREGVDTKINPDRRKLSINNFKRAGLSVGTCVEPVGPEHTNDELADIILYTASINPAFSGAARRISIPGGVIESRGMISELRMAQIVAVTRLAMPRSVIGNCTHEPCTLGALAGANLFWAERGGNPRDVNEKTEEGRGDTVEQCRLLYREAGCNVAVKPSAFFKN